MSTSSTSRVTQPVRRSTPKAPGLFLAATLTWTWLFLGIAAVLGRPWSSDARRLPLPFPERRRKDC